MNYYLPKYKWQLINWLLAYYPGDKNRFKTMNKKRLYAIYFSKLNRIIK